MIEPTESEGLAELDRFCERMIAIRKEIDEVAAAPGRRTTTPCAVRRTPASCLAGEWDRPYSRELAAYPQASPRPASTGRRCAASTGRTATATWSARAPRRRRTS
jgi:glycine dehydrogenase